MSDITQIGSNINGRINSVSINGTGNIVAIGSEYQNRFKGLTKIYKWNGTNWGQLGNNIIGEANSDRSGCSVSLNSQGNIVAIGARVNDGGGDKSGHTRIYEYNSSSNTWVKLGGDIDGEASDDQSGYSVSLNSQGNIVAIGAPYNNGSGSYSGQTRIYEYNSSSNAWTQLGGDIDGETANDESGFSVSLNSVGDIVAIGAPLNNGNGTSSGSTRIFQYNSSSNTWVQLGGDIDGEASSERSGYSVSLNSQGNIVAIGAPLNNSNKGKTRIYEWNGTSWNKLGSDIDGEAGNDWLGWSVSLNSVGDIVAIGSYLHDSNRGTAKIYQYNSSSTSWVQFGSDIDGQASGNQFGYSVSLNNQGDIVAIGAYEGRYTQVYELDIDLNLDDLVNSDVSMISPVVDATSRVTVNKVVTGNTSIASFTAANVTVPSGNQSIMILSLDAFDLADNQLNLTGLTDNNRIYVQIEINSYNPSNTYTLIKLDENLDPVSSIDYPVTLSLVSGTTNTLEGYLTGLTNIGVTESGQSLPCFHEETKILCYNPIENVEYFKKIDDIKENELIKSYGTKKEYTKIKNIKITYFPNNYKELDKVVDGYPINKLNIFYKNKKYNDIIVTGGHSILKKDLSLNEEFQMQNFIEKSKNNDEMKIGEYTKILACFSDDYEIYKHNGSINKIYSLILDEGNENQTFGIYLENNLMVESCNEKYINKFYPVYSI